MTNSKKESILILIITSLFFVASASAQPHVNWHFKNKIQLSEKVEGISNDPYGNLYINDIRGKIIKVDSNGIAPIFFSPKRNSSITYFDAWRKVNVFVFYRNLQEYRILDRFLTEISIHKIPPSFVGYCRVAALSNDNNLWVVDDNDLTLKKVNLKFNRLDVSNSLMLVLPRGEYDFTLMRAYENQLYILDKNSGILIFDNLGNYKSRIELKNVLYFDFIGDKLYFLQENKLETINIYTNQSQSIILPLVPNIKHFVLTKKHAYLIQDTSIHIFLHDMEL